MDKEEVIKCIDNYDFICAYEKAGSKFFEIFEEYLEQLERQHQHEKIAKIEIALAFLLNKDLAKALLGENEDLAIEIVKLIDMGITGDKDRRKKMLNRVWELNKKYTGIVYLVDGILHLIEAQYDKLVEIKDFGKEITENNLDEAIKYYEDLLKAIDYDYEILKGIAKYSTKISEVTEKLRDLKDRVIDLYYLLLKKKGMNNSFKG